MPLELKELKKDPLTRKQEMTYKIFVSVISKQDYGKVGAKEVEQILTIAERAAARLLEIK